MPDEWAPTAPPCAPRSQARGRSAPVANRLDTALHITVLHHGLYVGVIPIWGGLARPNGRASWHDQMFIELNSLGLDVSTSSEVEAGETADPA
jgi:hypothetical protein